jgi:predicted DCC family thiol-disulfide oxidoreductase YuxK
LYLGGCPLCAREIAFYDRLNRNSSSRIAFINLEVISPLTTIITATHLDKNINIPTTLFPSHLQQLTHAYDINIPAAYRRLHALREDGTLHISAHAFCEIWQRLPYWRILETFVQNIPGVLPMADVIYEFFAAKRIKWRQSLSPTIACSMKNK